MTVSPMVPQDAAMPSGSVDATPCQQPQMRPCAIHVVGIAGPSGSGKTTLAQGLSRRLNRGRSKRVLPLSMDNFFDRQKIHHVLQGKWETPDGIDIDRFMAVLRALVTERRVLDDADSLTFATHRGLVSLREEETQTDLLGEGGALGERAASAPGGDIGTSGQPASSAAATGEPVVVVVEGFLLGCFPKVVAMCDDVIFLHASETVAAGRRWKRESRKAKWAHPEGEAAFRRWYKEDVWANYVRFQPVQLSCFRRWSHDDDHNDGGPTISELSATRRRATRLTEIDADQLTVDQLASSFEFSFARSLLLFGD